MRRHISPRIALVGWMPLPACDSPSALPMVHAHTKKNKHKDPTCWRKDSCNPTSQAIFSAMYTQTQRWYCTSPSNGGKGHKTPTSHPSPSSTVEPAKLSAPVEAESPDAPLNSSTNNSMKDEGAPATIQRSQKEGSSSPIDKNVQSKDVPTSPSNMDDGDPIPPKHPLFDRYYDVRFGKRPTNRMQAEKTTFLSVSPQASKGLGIDYSSKGEWTWWEIGSCTAVVAVVLSYVGYRQWRRWFGSERIVETTELDAMKYLLDPANHVEVIFVESGTQTATVHIPIEKRSDDLVSFRFHVSNLAHLEDALRGMDPPRHLMYEGGIGLPLESFFLSLLVVPALLLLRFRVVIARVGGSASSSAPNGRGTTSTTPQRAMGRRGGAAGGANQPTTHFKVETSKSKTRFQDIAGMTEPKNEVREVVDFLVSPEKYHRLGATVPKGILLSGVPGVGKTMLARAVAGEADVNFIYCAGSEFVEIFVGVGAARIRELFRTASENVPCVIFIDEIDSFAKSRRMGSKGQSEGDSTINALLSEMDGFHPTSGIVVMAGTNRIDVLDEALLRPGRFDRKITIDCPPFADRVDIFSLHLRKLKLHVTSSDRVDALAKRLAALTPGSSGAEIKNICNESAIIAARHNQSSVDDAHFQLGLDRVQLGLQRKSAVLTQTDRVRAACHEAGHVIVNWNLELCDPIQKVTILPYSGKKASINRRLPQEKFIRTQAELLERVCDLLGGYAAEWAIFQGEVSSSAADDLHAATQLARQIVVLYGMCPEEIGHFSFPSTEYSIHNPYSTATEQKIDTAVSNIVMKAQERARAIVQANEYHIRAIQGSLLKQETLTAKDIALILGPKKGASDDFFRILSA